jgi:hypothetical protein
VQFTSYIDSDETKDLDLSNIDPHDANVVRVTLRIMMANKNIKDKSK